MMKLTNFLMSSVVFAGISVAAFDAAQAQAPATQAPQPQVLGTPSAPDAPPSPATPTAPNATAPVAAAPAAPSMPPPPSPAELTEVPAATPTPSPDALVSPQQAATSPSTPALVTPTVAPPSPDMMQAVSGDSTVTKITPSEKDASKPDVYYDSRLNVPTGPLANSVGPRKVDPVQEPGSKYVIARQNAKASDQEAMLVAANRALDLGRNDAALEMFEQLYQKNARDPRIIMGRAVAQQKLGLDDMAIVSYQSLLDLEPNNPDAIINMMGLIQKQYPAVALRRLTDLQSKYPTNAGIAAQMGMTFAKMGDSKEAIKALGVASSLEPNNALHDYNMAIVYDRVGDKTQALRYYEQALQTDAVYGGGRSIPRDKVYDRLAKLRQ